MKSSPLSIPPLRIAERGNGGEAGGRTGHAYTRYSHMARGAEITLDLRRLVGRWSLRAAGHAGRFTYLILDMCRGLAEWRVYLPLAFRQAMTVGYGSLFIVLLVAGFTG